MPINLLWLALFVSASGAFGSWDVGPELNRELKEQTDGRVQVVFEFRSRAESRGGQSFGIDPDLVADFVRTRVGVRLQPASWLRITATGMDARAPWYGRNAPGSARDPFDLHELTFELRPAAKTGFGASFGRLPANYGDTRLIGSPAWAYITRIYDGGRAWYRWKRLRLEALLLAPVKTDGTRWNRPVMGDRVEGMYNTIFFPRKASLEFYVLRHHQNRPGGYTGLGRFITDSFGAHLFGPLANGFRYNLEGVAQTGKIGALEHRAHAWVVQVGKQTTVLNRQFDAYAEYKFASGEHRVDRSGAFDQIYPAAHDKFGHADLIGWRNNRNLRVAAIWSVSKAVTLNAMYNNTWLADARDALYSTAGRAIARSAAGTAGTHVGQEADLYGSYRRSGFTIGAGYGQFFSGEFIRKTTPNVTPHYLYIFQSYTF